MQVALKANNGKFVSAEQGGGLKYTGVYTNEAYQGVAPLYANREVVSDWETFEYIENNNNSFSLRTTHGYYLTSENGGGEGISTNRKEANAWEMFFRNKDSIVCWNGRNLICAELGSDTHLNGTREAKGSWETFEIVRLDNPEIEWPNEDTLRNFKGNFGGMPLGLSYAPNGILFTPAYVVYNDQTRDRIRKSYLDAGYLHYPLNLTNHSTIYRNYYPHWDDSLINKYLEELLGDRLVPVGFVMGDQDTEVNCKADPSLVPITIPKWEDGAPLRGPNKDQYNTFYLVKQKYPKSLLYWHNPPYQGAPFVEYSDWGLKPGDPSINAKVWHYMVDECEVKGLLFQGKAWENDGGDSISILDNFKDRLKHGINGWPIADLVDFEETVYYMFNLNGIYNIALDMALHVRSSVQELNGYCNG